jgi:hypothetical protein
LILGAAESVRLQRVIAFNHLQAATGDDLVANALRSERAKGLEAGLTAATEMMARLQPHLTGSPISEIPKYHFETILQGDKRQTQTYIVEKNIKHKYDNMSESNVDLKVLVEKLISGYSGQLTQQQVEDIITGFCKKDFRETVQNVFDTADNLDEALVEIVQFYSKQVPRATRCDLFHSYKVDMKNLRTSLQKLYALGCNAYKNTTKTKNSITEMAVGIALASFPKDLRLQMLEFMSMYDSVPEPFRKNLNWGVFIDKADQNYSISNKESASYKNVRQATAANENKENTKDEKDAAIFAMIQSIQAGMANFTPNRAPQANAGPSNGPSESKSRRVGNAYKAIPMFRVGEAEFHTEAMRLQNEPGSSVAKYMAENNERNFNKCKKPRRALKTIPDPSANIPYHFTENNTKYWPQAPAFGGKTLCLIPGQTKAVMSDAVLQWAEVNCYLCGEPFCGCNALK